MCRYMCNLGSPFLFHIILQKLLSFLEPQFPYLKKRIFDSNNGVPPTWTFKDLHVLACSWPPLFSSMFSPTMASVSCYCLKKPKF